MNLANIKRIGDRLVACLPESDDLRRAPWKGSKNPLSGHCYVINEALYHLTDASKSGLHPTGIKHEGGPHWYLVHDNGEVIDLTSGQFKTPVPYSEGRGRGFLTKLPSKRAQELIRRAIEKFGSKGALLK